MSKKLPSPCIDVCKFRRGGHCIGCSMTKAQKKMFKALKKPEHQEAFVEMLVHQQNETARERDRARAEAAEAEEVSTFLVNLFEAVRQRLDAMGGEAALKGSGSRFDDFDE